MNPWQMAQQIRYLLRQHRWQEGAGDPVFGDSVFVYAGQTPDGEAIPPGFPFALVGLDSKTHDEDTPELLSQDFSIIVAVEVAGDPLGEYALIGGARPDAASSSGAGVAEVVEEVHRAVASLTGADGARILCSATGSSAASAMLPGRHCAFEQLRLSAWCTAESHYPTPEALNVTADEWTWTGGHCSSRFDFVRYQLGYVTGSTPAATFADVEGVVYQGAGTFTTHTPVSGRTYSVFAEYSPRGGTDRSYSAGNEVGGFLGT